MKNITLNTRESNETNSNRSKFKYYLNAPIILKEKETLSLQSISRINDGVQSVYDEGLITLSGIQVSASSFSVLILNTPPYTLEFEVDLDNTSICTVHNSQGGLSQGSGCKLYISYWNNQGIFLKVARVMETGKNYKNGDYVILNKSAFPDELKSEGDMQLKLNIINVKSGKIKSKYKEGKISVFNISWNYGPADNASFYNVISPYLDLGQGLIVRFKTTSTVGSPIGITYYSHSSLGYGYEVGDEVLVDKKLARPVAEGQELVLPLKLVVASISNDTNQYDLTDNYKIELGGLLFNPNPIMRSNASNDLLICDKTIQVADDERLKETKICELEPQVIQNMELKFSPQLSSLSDFIISLKIS